MLQQEADPQPLQNNERRAAVPNTVEDWVATPESPSSISPCHSPVGYEPNEGSDTSDESDYGTMSTIQIDSDDSSRQMLLSDKSLKDAICPSFECLSLPLWE
ncbi:hypothetical protein CBL_20368 [Carabus blaptoides fortunei]